MYIILRYKHHSNLSVIKQRTYLERCFITLFGLRQGIFFFTNSDFQLLQQNLPVQR